MQFCRVVARAVAVVGNWGKKRLLTLLLHAPRACMLLQVATETSTVLVLKRDGGSIDVDVIM